MRLGKVWVSVLLVGATLALGASGFFFWADRRLANRDGFAAAAAESLHQPEVRHYVATQLVDSLGKARPETSTAVAAARPLIIGVVENIVDTDAFRALFRSAMREVHRTIVRTRDPDLSVPIPDAGALLKSALQAVDPSLAAKIPDGALTVALNYQLINDIVRNLQVAYDNAWLFLVIAVALYAVAIAFARERRWAVVFAGVALAVGGLAMQNLLLNAAEGVVGVVRERDAAAAATATAAVFTADFVQWAGYVVLIGLIVAAAGGSHGDLTLRGRFDVARAWFARQAQKPGWRVAGWIALIAVGWVTVTSPRSVGETLVQVAGMVAIYLGVVAILGALGLLTDRATSKATTSAGRAVRRATVFALAGALVVAVLTTALIAVATPSAAKKAIRADGCNGSEALCDRRIDQVVFPGSHNSMAATGEPDWFFTEQGGGVPAQLSAGVRALFIDAYYAAKVGSFVRTDVTASRLDVEKVRAEAGPDAVRAVDQVAALAGAIPNQADRQIYFCHLFCETGATQGRVMFERINDFLVENPNQVVLVVVEDYVTDDAMKKLLEDTGLIKRAWRYDPSAPLPTLRTMIEKDHNLLIAAEKNGGKYPFYPNVYATFAQETPYAFSSIEQLEAPASCAENRGAAHNPVFLMNHWVTPSGPTSPEEAAKANAFGAIVDRARMCEQIRGRRVNIASVNFYDRGDLFAAVAVLNGLAPG